MNATDTTTVKYPMPDEISDSWTPGAKILLGEIYDWLNADPANRNKALLARISGLKDGTFATIISGAYKSSPDKQLRQIVQAMHNMTKRKDLLIDEDPYIETSVAKLTYTICERARTYRRFGIVSGYVGTGKTTALKRYVSDNPGTILVEADPVMSPMSLLTDICADAGCPVLGTKDFKFRTIVKTLKGADRLLIIDEAETMMPSTLEYLRRIRDKADIGVVLAGTERLKGMIRREHGQFDQIRSRVVMWPELIKGITRDDATQIIKRRYPRITEEAIDTLFGISRGSARVLADDLLPAISDYGPQILRHQQDTEDGGDMGDGARITPKMISMIASKIIGL